MNTADKPPEDVAQELEVPERLPEEIDTDILPFLSRSAEVSSGRFETPEIRWKRPLSRMTSATLPVYVSRLSEFSVPLLPITREGHGCSNCERSC